MPVASSNLCARPVSESGASCADLQFLGFAKMSAAMTRYNIFINSVQPELKWAGFAFQELLRIPATVPGIEEAAIVPCLPEVTATS